jgi:hypothetical protein
MTEITDRVFERLSERLPADRAYTLDAISEADVPDGVTHFLAQTLQRRLELEADALAKARSRWFDYGNAELQKAQADYLAALAQHAQVPAEEWHRTLRQAVLQVVPYLVQPARTLVRFVFPPGRDELPADVVRRRMRYFNAYGYLNEVVRAYLAQKGEEIVTRNGLTRLLQRIEHRTPSEYTPAEWIALLDQLYETVGEGRPRRVETELLGRFFRDKGMQNEAAAIEQSGHTIGEADLARLLAPLAPLAASAAGVEGLTPPAVVPLEQQAEPEVVAPAPAEAPSEQQAEVQPLWQRFAQPKAEAPKPKASGAQPLWQRFGRAREDAVPAEPDLPTERDADLERLEQQTLGRIPVSQRRLYVRDLFSGSERAYRETLGRIAIAASWSEASKILGAVYRDHQVNIYSATAVAFTEAAEQRFVR